MLHSGKKTRPRVFIGLFEIASYYSALKEGFDELGIDAVFVELGRNRLTREVKGNPRHWILSLVQDVALMSEINFRSQRLSQVYRYVFLPAAKFLLLTWAILRYDVFVFGFATSFFGFKELPILKMLGKKIIYVFNGSDSRPPYISGYFVYNESETAVADCLAATLRQKKTVAAIERYADICVNHPPQAHFHERRFINHCFIGHPCKLPARTGATAGARSPDLVRIVHAPSNPKLKGTEIIRRLVAKLQEDGCPIRYVELINRPNAEVLDELAECDLVIDELYSDIPLAGLGTEASFFGKPAVVGGYAERELQRYAPQAGLPLTLYVRPENVEATVRRLVDDRLFREQCGAVAQRFVTKEWATREVAQRFLRLIDGDIPAEWWYDPNSNQYLHGWGAPERELRNFMRRFIAKCGVSALRLTDKPELEKEFLKFIEDPPHGSNAETPAKREQLSSLS